MHKCSHRVRRTHRREVEAAHPHALIARDETRIQRMCAFYTLTQANVDGVTSNTRAILVLQSFLHLVSAAQDRGWNLCTHNTYIHLGSPVSARFPTHTTHTALGLMHSRCDTLVKHLTLLHTYCSPQRGCNDGALHSNTLIFPGFELRFCIEGTAPPSVGGARKCALEQIDVH